MTTLGRSLWWVVLVTAAVGLLLSVVMLVRPTPDPATAEVVRGGASAASVPGSAAAAAPLALPGTVFSTRQRPAPQVDRASAALTDLRTPRVRPPRRVRVPSLDLDLAVRSVGVARGRQMELPRDPRVLGWYRYGPAPGQSGSAVLAGHVDSQRFGVGPLADLGAVRPGARIDVTLRSGRRMVYRVDSVERFDRQALPDEVFSRDGRSRLRLVTCTGAFLPEAGGYQENLVVTAVLA
ncbi:class F sortase [Nocardioides coralli]|uniref:class F sortase n=1 Tax=Nocardioides coralli TaxID=2872154 RepID=UPI001CA38C80|nr:class F sortase [Nocardioides coralli]QZY28322.1 class F sortase [Nocardioides coralli]